MLIYLDVETTGLDARDRICALGLILDDGSKIEVYEEYVKPTCKISTEAMAVHHITNEMLQDSAGIESSKVMALLDEYNSVDNTLVVHNINFDLEMLAKEGFIWSGALIDTMKCSKHLIEEIDRFSLQYLRYELGLYKKEQEDAVPLGIQVTAHNALSDAFHTRRLHHYLKEIADDDTLMMLTTEPVLIKKLNFGKYKGHYLEEIAMNDVGYLQWLLNQEIDEDLEFSIKQNLEGL